ncbi:MAG: response regulator transcription factor [Bdellovibrionales bacterium]|nr:response regulator transcription factor [Bdellovibrionales bacterium]
MSQQVILLIEDEKEIRDLMRASLESHGYAVREWTHGGSVIKTIESVKPNLILVDQLLPHKLGTDIIKDIRADHRFYQIPVIMVTGCDGEAEKVQGLTVGADDYVTKPFSRAELLARARAVLRRVTPSPEIATGKIDKITHRDLVLDMTAHRAVLAGKEVPLTLTEFKILYELMTNPDKVLTRLELCERVLGRTNVTDRTIDVHVAALRKKVGDISREIQTVRGVGYRFGQMITPVATT